MQLETSDLRKGHRILWWHYSSAMFSITYVCTCAMLCPRVVKQIVGKKSLCSFNDCYCTNKAIFFLLLTGMSLRKLF